MNRHLAYSILAFVCVAGIMVLGCGPQKKADQGAAPSTPQAAGTPASPAAAADTTGGVLTSLPGLAEKAMEAVKAAQGDQVKIEAIKKEMIDKSLAVIGGGIAVPAEQQGHQEDFEVIGGKVTNVQWRPGVPPFLNFELTVKGKKETSDITVPCDFVDSAGTVLHSAKFYLPTGGRMFVGQEGKIECYDTENYSTYKDFAKLIVK